MTSCGFCTTQWATGVRPDLAAHWADHPAAPVAEIDKPSRCRHQQAERNLSHRDVVHAVVEATRNWMVIYDWLDDICDDVVLAHPLKVKAIADAKIKTDKIDATVLAHLLRADLVPQAWAPTEEAREPRLALRERMFYVRLRTMVKNRVVTIFDRYPEQTVQLRKLADLFGKAGRKQLAELPSRRSIASRSTAASPSSTTSMRGSNNRKLRSGR
jgi:transposase